MDETSEVESVQEVRMTTDVPRGPRVSQQHVDTVNGWWKDEMEPWKSIILGFSGYEAMRYDSMSQWDQWVYRKYRFDHQFFYKDVAPPPIEMWTSGIFDINSVAAQQWFHDRNIREMVDEWSDSSSEEQTTAPPSPPAPPMNM